MMKIPGTIIWLLVLMAATYLNAQVRLPKIIGSNMVLQREKPAQIWGWASSGEKITCSLKSKKSWHC